MKNPPRIKIIAFALAMSLSLLHSSAEEYLSHELTGSRLNLQTNESLYSFSFPTAYILKISATEDSTPSNKLSHSVVFDEKIEPTLLETETDVEFFSKHVRVRIQKDPFSVRFIGATGNLITEISEEFEVALNSSFIGFRISENEHIQGSGSRAIPSNRNGRRLHFFNQAHYGYDNNQELLNITIPLVVSNNGYALFFDESSPAVMDIGQIDSSQLGFETEDNDLTCYLITGNNYDRILREFTLLTGRQPLPPRWTLGYIQSKYGYETETEARSIVSRMREGDYPMDAIILDLQWMGGHLQMGDMDWDLNRFPTPIQMLEDFKSTGIKSITIFEPYITNRSNRYTEASNLSLFTTQSSGDPWVYPNFWAGPASLLDITKSETLDWWWEIYKQHQENGIEGLWNDLGEPEMDAEAQLYSNGQSARELHNLYSLLWAKMLDERTAEHFPDKRLFNLIRSGWAGMQRYRTFPWSGDISRTYSGMAIQIPLISGMSMSGVGYMHCDIGGFTNGPYNAQLYTRWVQIGTFLPVMRVHGTGIDMEPYNYPEPYSDICRNYMKLRYQLLPYNYTLAFWNSYSGRPLVLPMNYFEPQNEVLGGIDKQFYWGESILVAPVLEDNQTEVEVTFPAGKWVDPDTLETFDGHTTMTVEAPIEKIPYFIRAGSFIPRIKEATSTQFVQNDYYHIQYYADSDIPNSFYMIYEDDGETENSFKHGQFRLLPLEASFDGNNLTLSINSSGPGYSSEPTEKVIEFEIIGITAPPSDIKIGEKTLNYVESANDYLSIDEGSFWDSNRSTLWVKFTWTGSETQMAASF